MVKRKNLEGADTPDIARAEQHGFLNQDVSV